MTCSGFPDPLAQDMVEVTFRQLQVKEKMDLDVGVLTNKEFA